MIIVFISHGFLLPTNPGRVISKPSFICLAGGGVGGGGGLVCGLTGWLLSDIWESLLDFNRTRNFNFRFFLLFLVNLAQIEEH